METSGSVLWKGVAAVAVAAVVAGVAWCRLSEGCPLTRLLAPGDWIFGDRAVDGSSPSSSSMKEGQAMAKTENAKIEHAGDRDFSDKVLNAEVPVLVDFYADWCGPCRAMAPLLEEIAEEAVDAKVVKVNVDEAPRLASEYGISAIPTLLVFKDGKVVNQHLGMASKGYLKSLIR